MKKAELKKLLKPMIKECIKEVIFEDGTLSSIISEVVQGVGQPIVEQKQSLDKIKFNICFQDYLDFTNKEEFKRQHTVNYC